MRQSSVLTKLFCNLSSMASFLKDGGCADGGLWACFWDPWGTIVALLHVFIKRYKSERLKTDKSSVQANIKWKVLESVEGHLHLFMILSTSAWPQEAQRLEKYLCSVEATGTWSWLLFLSGYLFRACEAQEQLQMHSLSVTCYREPES